MKIPRVWFNEPSRPELKKFIEKNIDRQMITMGSPAIYDSEDKPTLYKMGMSGGQLACYQLLYYLLIDQTNRPSLVRADQYITESLNSSQFLNYKEKLLQRLMSRAPSTNYCGLVYHQTIINLLSKLELKDGS